MSIVEILQLVSAELDINLTHLNKCRSDVAITAKYTAFLLMYEEGFGAVEISKQLNIARGNVHYGLERANAMLEFDKPFKQAYLRCIARIAEKEDAVCA